MSADGTKGVVIVGAGGFGREVLQYAHDIFADASDYRVKGFVDDRHVDLASFGLDAPLLGDTVTYVPDVDDRFVIAVGEPQVRARLAAHFAELDAEFLTLVHPAAYVSGTARLGRGCIVAPFATVGAHATVGDHTVLTFYASVGHDAVVGSYCAFSPHSVTNGGSQVGDRVFLGAHAVVNPLLTVGHDAKIAASSVVYRPVAASTLAAGNPARTRPVW